MRYVLVSILFCGLLASGFAAITKLEDILLLDANSMDEALAQYDNLLVYFDRFGDEDSDDIALEETKEWANVKKLNNLLKDSGVPYAVGIVDATDTANNDMLHKYEVANMGTEVYLFKQHGIFYTKVNKKKVQTERKVKEWFLNKVQHNAQDITCRNIPDKLKEVSNRRVLIYYTENEDSAVGHPFFDILNFTPIGQNFEIFHLTDKECAKSYGANREGDFILFRSFDDKALVYEGDPTDLPRLQDWIWENSHPPILDVNDGNFDLLMSQKKPIAILFKQGNYKERKQAVEQLQAEFGNEYLFAVSDNKQKDEEELAKFLGADLNQLIVFEPHTGRKFRVDLSKKGIIYDQMKEFLLAHKAKQLSPYLKSQKVEEDVKKKQQKQHWITMTGENHDEVIRNHDGDFLVVYCSEKGPQCRGLKGPTSRLASKLKTNDRIQIGKFDTDLNELPNESFNRLPLVYLYPNGSQTPIQYDGRSYDYISLLEWLVKNGPEFAKNLDLKDELTKDLEQAKVKQAEKEVKKVEKKEQRKQARMEAKKSEL